MTASILQGQWPLPNQAIIHANGTDAAHFLHGQLSNAVEGLDNHLARPAAYCTAQGRVLANGVFWQHSESGIRWMVSQDLAQALVRRLGMFVLRAKVSLSLETDLRIYGAAGAPWVPEPLHPQPSWSRLDIDGDTWIVAPQSRPDAPAAWRIQRTPKMTSTTGSSSDDDQQAKDNAARWQAARLASGWPWIRASSQDMFLPSALNMDNNGSIDFKKGCYPGQEVVARSHYRGTTKRRMALGGAVWPQGREAPRAGSDLFAAGQDATSRPVGRLIEAIATPGYLHVAAEITISDWPSIRYAIGGADGVPLDLALL